jgi:hypothetical protein
MSHCPEAPEGSITICAHVCNYVEEARVIVNYLVKLYVGDKRICKNIRGIILKLILEKVGVKSDEIENKMGGACSSDGKRKECTGFWWGNLRERDHWRERGVDERIIFR